MLPAKTNLKWVTALPSPTQRSASRYVGFSVLQPQVALTGHVVRMTLLRSFDTGQALNRGRRALDSGLAAVCRVAVGCDYLDLLGFTKHTRVI